MTLSLYKISGKKMTKPSPSVSVIVPIYNVEQYLVQCLESLAIQTLTDIEIILVNDGSTDNSGKIAEGFIVGKPNFKLFHKSNGGLSDARNFGIKKAAGKYIGFVDSDDWVEPEMYEKMFQKVIQTKSEIVVCPAKLYFEEKNLFKPMPLRSSLAIFGTPVVENPLLLYAAHSYAWNKLFHRDFFSTKNKFRFPVGKNFEDSHIIYNIMATANKIEFVDEYLYLYRYKREGAITTLVDNSVFDIYDSCESIINYFESNNLLIGKVPEVLEPIIRNHLMARFNQVLDSGQRKLAWKYTCLAFDFLDTKFPGWKTRYWYADTKRESWIYSARRNKMIALLRILSPKFLKTILRKTTRVGRNLVSTETPKGKKIPTQKLRELQQIQIEILNSFADICEEHNLKYYLAEGTLLGAVRHGGMIPWDDDIDVAMPREDYDKLLLISADQWTTDLQLWSKTTDKRYPYPFSKLITASPSDFKSAWPNDTAKKFNGPFIDIFPLDKGPAKFTKYDEGKHKELRRLRDILLLKRNYPSKPSRRVRILKALGYVTSYKSLHDKIEKISRQMENSVYRSNIVNYASSYAPSNQSFPADWFGEPDYIMFENHLHPIPTQSVKILEKIYGDYLVLPPLEKRGRGTHFMQYVENRLKSK